MRLKFTPTATPQRWYLCAPLTYRGPGHWYWIEKPWRTEHWNYRYDAADIRRWFEEKVYAKG